MLFGLLYEQRRLLVLSIGIIIVAGLTSAMVMPRMEDPELTQRVGTVRTTLPGATTSRVESLVADKVIEELREIEEVKQIRSASRPSISTVRVTLKDDVYEVDEVWSRVRDRLKDVRAELPDEAEDPDLDVLELRSYSRIIGISWNGSGEPSFNILARVADELKDVLRDVPGTEVVDVFGEPEEELLVEIDSEQLRASGLSATEVADQISQSDPKVSAGQIRGDRSDMLLEIGGELDSIQRIGNISLRSETTGQSLMLGDIATVQRSIVSPPESLALVNGNRGILIGAILRTDSKIDSWSKRIDEKLSAFKAGLPPSLVIEEVFNQDAYVTARLSELVSNLGLTCLIVSVVVLLMLGWRSALVVCAALPLTGCMVLAGLRYLEIPLHQMSLTGLIISLGLLIDNAIVAADEVQHRLRQGVSGLEAVRGACRQLFLPLVGSTVTTALSFTPIALIPGPSGEFVGTIAVSVILAISCSLFVSLGIVAAITAIFFPNKKAQGRGQGWTFGIQSDLVTKAYEKLLGGLFRVPIIGIGLCLIPPMLGFYVAPQMTEQFFPPAERDQFHVEIELGSEASIGETTRTAQQVSRLMSEVSAVERVDWVVGESIPSFYYNVVPRVSNTPRYAQAHVRISGGNVTEVINLIQKRLSSEITEAQCRVRQLEQGPPFNAPIEVRLLGQDTDTLMELGERVRARLTQDVNVTCTQADLSDSMPKLVFDIGEQEAQMAGLELREIATQLNQTLEGALGGSVIEGTEELKTRVRLTGNRRTSVSDIEAVDLINRSSSGGGAAATPVSAIAQAKLVPQLSLVSRMDGRPMNEVRAYTYAGVLPATVLDPFKEDLESGRFDLPAGYEIEFGGESSERNDAVEALYAQIGMVVVLMITALVMSLQSFRAATIISAVAGLSFGLGFLSVWLFGFPRGFTSIVGTMGLIGIAINDSIVVLAAVRRNVDAARGDVAATVKVVVRETRHVLATTLTTVAGLMPLFLTGGDFWAPLVIAIAGGVLGATLLALIAVPSAHLLLTRFQFGSIDTSVSNAAAKRQGGH